ncbi:MAG TPA: 3-oxoacyl-ACP synthase [Armatimonadetes bacterium]|jgi:3-oxoacyl-[acyl-carrier-protein] synthase-3|nr:3-oxoacyl-ACP synthase [Armatimonadota bacterium]
MNLRGCTITGFGSHVPDRVLTNADLEKIVDTTDEWIVVHTGISERRVIEDGKATSDLAVEAARRALDDAAIDAADLQLIIGATITADTVFPSMSAVLEHKLGANRAATFDLVTGCTGFVDGIVTAAQFIRTGAMDRILVVAGDALTRITNWSDRSTCVLFGDAATAAVLQPSEPDRGLLGWAMDTQGFAGEHLCIPSSGSAWPPDEKAIAENATKLYMNGHEIFKMAVRGVPDIAMQALDKAGLSSADVDWVIMHQANQRILDAAADRLDIPHDRVISVLHKFGNTSAASMGLALDEIYQDGRLKKDDIVLLVGFGAGFCLAGAVLRWDK